MVRFNNFQKDECPRVRYDEPSEDEKLKSVINSKANSAYMLWNIANRKYIKQRYFGDTKVGQNTIVAKTGELWKNVPNHIRAIYEVQAAKNRAESKAAKQKSTPTKAKKTKKTKKTKNKKKTQKKVKPVHDDDDDDDDDVVTVKYWNYKGRDYLLDDKSGDIYDIKTHDVVGNLYVRLQIKK